MLLGNRLVFSFIVDDNQAFLTVEKGVSGGVLLS